MYKNILLLFSSVLIISAVSSQSTADTTQKNDNNSQYEIKEVSSIGV